MNLFQKSLSHSPPRVAQRHHDLRTWIPGLSGTLITANSKVKAEQPSITYCHVFRGVTIDGVWIGEWIYWPLIHTTRNYKHLQRHR
jgi:hypothetical protein